MSGSISGLIGWTGVWLFFGLSVGAIAGLGVGSLNHITLLETITWKWNHFWKSAIPGSGVGLIGGLGATHWSGGLTGILRLVNGIMGVCIGLTLGAIGELILGLVFGLVSGLVGGFTGRVKMDKVYPNQGINLSVRNSLAVFLVIWLLTALIVGVIGRLSGAGEVQG